MAVGFFGGAVPLAVHIGDWKFWRGQGSDSDNEMFNIHGIISSCEATAVSLCLRWGSPIETPIWRPVRYKKHRMSWLAMPRPFSYKGGVARLMAKLA